MPSLKELMTPQNVGILIYSELMPIPGGVLEQVEKAEKAFDLLGGAMPERASLPARDDVEKTPRQRAAINRDIVAFLSVEPLKMWTPRQIFNAAIKSAYPKQTIEQLQTRLKSNAGKPDMWIAAGGKYGMAGAEAKASTTKAKASTTEANTNVVPAPPALPGEKTQARVFSYIEAHLGCTKAQVIAAFKTSPNPVKENHVGIALGRLRSKSKKITDTENGPYWTLPAATMVPTTTTSAS